MSNLQPQRPQSQSSRRRRPQSALSEEIETDAKAYRYLLSLLVDNINMMARTHRQCFGDIQQQAKIKISRQEQQMMNEQLLKIYSRFEDKLTRELIYRNNLANKTYSQFYTYYSQTHNEAQVQNTTFQSPQEQNLIHQNNFITALSAKKIASFFNSAPPKRPMSSRYTADFTVLNQAIAGFKKTVAGQTYKTKTISAQINENPEIKNLNSKHKSLMVTLQKTPIRDELLRGKKSLPTKNKQMLAQKRYNKRDDGEGFNFNGNEIVISENRYRNSQPDQSNNKMTPKMIENAKICGKRMLNLKYSQRRSIDEIERMQIQSRIMMVSSVLSVNLPQSQGYRPKSKCWQNYFNY